MGRREQRRISTVCPRLKYLRFKTVDRHEELDSFCFRQRQKFFGQVNLVGFDSTRAGRNALRLKERVRHRTSNKEHVRLLHQRLDHFNLIGDL